MPLTLGKVEEGEAEEEVEKANGEEEEAEVAGEEEEAEADGKMPKILGRIPRPHRGGNLHQTSVATLAQTLFQHLHNTLHHQLSQPNQENP